MQRLENRLDTARRETCAETSGQTADGAWKRLVQIETSLDIETRRETSAFDKETVGRLGETGE